jgi:hypothetical protein
MPVADVRRNQWRRLRNDDRDGGRVVSLNVKPVGPVFCFVIPGELRLTSYAAGDRALSVTNIVGSTANTTSFKGLSATTIRQTPLQRCHAETG